MATRQSKADRLASRATAGFEQAIGDLNEAARLNSQQADEKAQEHDRLVEQADQAAAESIRLRNESRRSERIAVRIGELIA